MLPRRLHYHTYDHFVGSGLRSFLDHASEYLQGQTTVPVSLTHYEQIGQTTGPISLFNKHAERYVYFTFSDQLLKMFVKNSDILKRSYAAAIMYGFRGHSLGNKNGIFYVAKRDQRLSAAIDRLAVNSQNAIEQDLEIPGHLFEALKKVKIVCHEPSGKRVVGLLNEKNFRIIFLGIVQY
jgi:hypothetical protein